MEDHNLIEKVVNSDSDILGLNDIVIPSNKNLSLVINSSELKKINKISSSKVSNIIESIKFININDSAIAIDYVTKLGKLEGLKNISLNLINKEALGEKKLKKIRDALGRLFKGSNKLSRLYLSGLHAKNSSDWEGILDLLKDKTTLQEVALVDCVLNDDFFNNSSAKYLFVDKNIKKLDLSNNLITNKKVSMLSSGLLLDKLDIYFSSMVTSALEEINLSDNKFTSDDLMFLANTLDVRMKKCTTQLAKLSISSEHINKLAFLIRFAKFPHRVLTVLDLSNTKNIIDKDFSNFVTQIAKNSEDRISIMPKIILPNTIKLEDELNKIPSDNVRKLLTEKLQNANKAQSVVPLSVVSDHPIPVESAPEQKPTAGAGITEEEISQADSNAQSQLAQSPNTDEIMVSSAEAEATAQELSDDIDQKLQSLNEIYIKQIVQRTSTLSPMSIDNSCNIINSFNEINRNYLNELNSIINQLQVKLDSLQTTEQKNEKNIAQLSNDLDILKKNYLTMCNLNYKLDIFFNLYEDENKIKLSAFYLELYNYLYRYYIGISAAHSGIVPRSQSWKDTLVDVGIFIMSLIATAAVAGTVAATFGATLAATPAVIAAVAYGGNKLREVLRDKAKIKEFKMALTIFEQYDNIFGKDMQLRMLAFTMTYMFQEQILHVAREDVLKLAQLAGDKFAYTVQKARDAKSDFRKSVTYEFISKADNTKKTGKGLDIFKKPGFAYIYTSDNGNTMVHYYDLNVSKIHNIRDKISYDVRYSSNSKDYGYIYFPTKEEAEQYKQLLEDSIKNKESFHNYIFRWDEKTIILNKSYVEKGAILLSKPLTWDNVKEIEATRNAYAQGAKPVNSKFSFFSPDTQKLKMANVNNEYRGVLGRLEQLKNAIKALAEKLKLSPSLAKDSDLQKQLDTILNDIENLGGKVSKSNSP